MNKIKTDKILKLLDIEIYKIRESAKKTDEASKVKLTGWSAAGDKYHALAAADLADSFLKRLEFLKNELQKGFTDNIQVVNPPCYLRIKYDDGQTAELYLVKNAVSLPGISFISVDSPLGKAVLGKKINDVFNYELENGNKYSGIIIELE